MEIMLCVFTVSCGIWFPDLLLAAYGEFLFQNAPGLLSRATSVKEHFEILLNVFFFVNGGGGEG